MFAVVMPFGAIASDVKRKRPPSPLVPMCEVTGGRAFTAQHLKHALQLAETIAAQKLQSGVNVVFDALPPLTHRSEPFTRNPRRMLLVSTHTPQTARWNCNTNRTDDALGSGRIGRLVADRRGPRQ
jgi:hypothetical protein